MTSYPTYRSIIFPALVILDTTRTRNTTHVRVNCNNIVRLCWHLIGIVNAHRVINVRSGTFADKFPYAPPLKDSKAGRRLPRMHVDARAQAVKAAVMGRCLYPASRATGGRRSASVRPSVRSSVRSSVHPYARIRYAYICIKRT